jgi:hypothetical protein
LAEQDDSFQIWSNYVENEIEETNSNIENQLYGSSNEPSTCLNGYEVVSFNEKLLIASEFSTGDQEAQAAQHFEYSLLDSRNDDIQHQISPNLNLSDTVFLSQIEKNFEDDPQNSLSTTAISGESDLFDLYKTNEDHYLDCLTNGDISHRNEPRTETTKPEIKLSTEAIKKLWLQIDLNAQRQCSTDALPSNDSSTPHCPEIDLAMTMISSTPRCTEVDLAFTMIENSNPALVEPVAMVQNSNPVLGEPVAMIESPNLVLEEPVLMIENANSATDELSPMVENSSNFIIEFPFTLNEPRHLAVEVKKKRGRPRKKMEPLAVQPDAFKYVYFFY